ncbi:MAG: hypothetical protein ACHQ2Z_09665 [Elusimicrobiota bacterium]
MKISRLGIVVALAALPPLSALRAAAQESSWAALGEAGSALASIRQAQAQTQQSPKPKPKPKPQPKTKPAPVGPSAPEQAWGKIVAAIRENGDFRPEKSMFIPARFGLRDVRGDEKGDHSVDSAEVVGSMTEAGLFDPAVGEFNSDEWKLGADGSWTVDHWQIVTDVYGTLKAVDRKTIVKAPDLKEVSSKDVAVKLDDPALAAKFKSVIEYWAAKQ